MTSPNQPNKSGRIFSGTVVSDKMAKTIVVSLPYKYRHPTYLKTIKKTKKVFSENNLNAKVGDAVKIQECRPLSARKRFTTLEIVKSA